MFPSRYYSPRYWAARFWAKVGALLVRVDPDPDRIYSPEAETRTFTHDSEQRVSTPDAETRIWSDPS